MASYIPEGQGSPSPDEGGRGGCAGCATGVACPGAAVSVWGPVSARAAETPAAQARRGRGGRGGGAPTRPPHRVVRAALAARADCSSS